MKVSIFTPTHDTKFLCEAYESIKEQNFYEWVIGYNGQAEPMEFNDPRVKTVLLGGYPPYVGALKKAVCESCTGDVLLELDHDDLLMPTAIDEVTKAFEDNIGTGFVYSNTIHSTQNFEKIQRFDARYGWKFREVEYQGHKLDEHISFEPNPNSVSRIWFAPNHLRAFRSEVYDEIGGYNPNMRILDDLDLMCRMYLHTKFRHIDKGLYIYRVHGQNSWLVHNAEIQNNVYRIHDKYIEDLCLRWADLNGLLKIELGGGMFPDKRFVSVDRKGGKIYADLDERFPFEDNSVGVLKANDTLEHLKDIVHSMKEIYRVLAPGGYAIICVPSTDGRGAFQDPTHKTFWNENSFKYFTESRFAQYIGTPVRFQELRLYTTEKNDDGVCWTIAHLVKLPCGRVPGLVNI